MRERLINLIIILVGLFLIINLVRSMASVSQNGSIIVDAQKRLVEEQEKNSKLQRDLAKIESPQYIEKQAREKLNLGKPGEYNIILPPITPQPSPTPAEVLTNWEQWVRVFY